MCIPQVLDQSFFSGDGKKFWNVNYSHFFDVNWPAQLINAMATEVEVFLDIFKFWEFVVIKDSIKVELLALSHKI